MTDLYWQMTGTLSLLVGSCAGVLLGLWMFEKVGRRIMKPESQIWNEMVQGTYRPPAETDEPRLQVDLGYGIKRRLTATQIEDYIRDLRVQITDQYSRIAGLEARVEELEEMLDD